MGISGLHHAAYRCKDAKETVAFYTTLLDLDFNIAVAENKVPSTGEFSPHIHIFLQLADGSFVAFFELPEDKGNMLDPETPAWVQHLALKVPDSETQLKYKARLEEAGVKVLGPTDHGICKSIYFSTPAVTGWSWPWIQHPRIWPKPCARLLPRHWTYGRGPSALRMLIRCTPRHTD